MPAPIVAGLGRVLMGGMGRGALATGGASGGSRSGFLRGCDNGGCGRSNGRCRCLQCC